jgi:hypothetical protein
MEEEKHPESGASEQFTARPPFLSKCRVRARQRDGGARTDRCLRDEQEFRQGIRNVGIDLPEKEVRLWDGMVAPRRHHHRLRLLAPSPPAHAQDATHPPAQIIARDVPRLPSESWIPTMPRTLHIRSPFQSPKP